MANRTRQHQRNSKGGWYVGGVIALVVVLAAIIAIGAGGGDGTSQVAAGVEQVRPISVVGNALPPLPDSGPDPATGLEAPVLTGQSFDGIAASTQSSSGRLLVFVAHWCPHCRREVPLLVQWAADGGVPAGLDVIGISTAVDRNAPNYSPSAWLEDEQFPWPVIVDDADQSAATAMGLPGFPYFVLLKADGTVALRVSGEIEPAALAVAITAALAA